jgi:hypothetical protein
MGPASAHPLVHAGQREAQHLADRHPLQQHHRLVDRAQAVADVRVEERGVLGGDDDVDLAEQVKGAT